MSFGIAKILKIFENSKEIEENVLKKFLILAMTFFEQRSMILGESKGDYTS